VARAVVTAVPPEMSAARGRELLPWVTAAALGIAAEAVSFGWAEPRHWMPDLITGWTLVACGLFARRRRRGSRVGVLLAAAGFAWFAGNFASAGWRPLAWAAAHLAFVHRGLLVHALLSYPTGRLRSRPLVAIVALAYAASLVLAVDRSDLATIVIGLGLVGAALIARLPARMPAVLFGIALAGGAALRLALPGGGPDEAALLVYEGAIWLTAVELLSGLRTRTREQAAVTDIVVELGEGPSETLRDALAGALGDPTLAIVYWGGGGVPIDAAGRPVAMPDAGPDRAVTPVERGGERVAALVHDPAVLEDPALSEAVAAAARLAAANPRLQSDVRAQLGELAASRRRLLEAGDEERRRLERELHEGAECRLEVLASILLEAGKRGAGDAVGDHLQRAQRQLERTLGDLHELARGLHPRVLADEGLLGGVRDLGAACPVSVEIEVDDVRLPAAVEVAAYFVCAEALANVVKHACARHVSVAVRRFDGRIAVEVRDDGAGGADPASGSGLRGLEDRVEALGGVLHVESAPGSGTLLAAEIPLGGEEG
jgi:signal transduction histidine kinase